jgi:hypothetical protein
MHPGLIRRDFALVLALAVVAGAAPSAAMDTAIGMPALTPSAADAMAQASPEAMAEYRRKLREYEQTWAPIEAYWNSIAEKRRGRNAKRRAGQQVTLDDYVLTQPPVYRGPPKPVDPSAPEPERRERKALPMVPDLIRAAAEHFQFTPQRPASDIEFKRAYARVAASAGLTREQAVRVYSFETGGNGNYDMQSGYRGPGTRPISTAIGYNQLLTTNSVELFAEQGDAILRALKAKAETLSGAPRKAMESKILVVRKMVTFAQSVPDTWSEHEKLADTEKGWALHAMVLDIDVGPHLQTHKLLTSVMFARAKGYTKPLTAAELEMMNLTGDGTGLDMVTMPQAMREQVPTSNFFQRAGYQRNPVASRNNTVAKLLGVTDQRMDFNANKPGAIELANSF